MHSDTKFAPQLNYTSNDLDAIRKYLGEHEAEERPCFTEMLKHEYNETGKQFTITADGQKLQFTYPAFIEFCSSLGIPGKFADRIPNELLVRNIDEMLGDRNDKVRLLVRDGNIVSGVKKDNYVATNPRSFVEAAEPLLNTHLFREASITDDGSNFLFEPMKEQTCYPGDQADPFNVGISFQLGLRTAVVEGRPYSLRHVCTNIAISAAEACKHRLIEKLRRTGSSRYYGRLLENYTSEQYKEWMEEVHNRLAKALKEPMTDWRYVEAYSRLSRLLGGEVALALIGTTEDRHEEIMLDVKIKKMRDMFTQKDSTVIDGVELYEVFNRVTAAAKTYTGGERIVLQQIGGEII